MLSVSSNCRVVNFSNRFINVGFPVLSKGTALVAMPSNHHPCSRLSASGNCDCRDTVLSTLKVRTSRHLFQHLSHSACSAASSWNRTPRIAPVIQRSCRPCHRTGDTAEVDQSLTNSKQKPETGRRK